MAIPVQITFDAHDPAAQSAFWALALDYVVQPPPPGFASWQDFARQVGIPQQDWDRLSAAVDPDGVGPRVLFQKVPEGRTVKNRVHLDVNAGPHLSGETDHAHPERRARAREHAERLVAAGARHVEELDGPAGWCLVMRDPEGNEFCVQ